MTHEEMIDKARGILRELRGRIDDEDFKENLAATEIVVNPRRRTTLGWAQRLPGFTDRADDAPWFRIELNPVIAQSDVLFLDVVLHEAAHVAIEVRGGHGGVWRHVARQFGAVPERYNSMPCEGVVFRQERRHPVRCLRCGREWTITTRAARRISTFPDLWTHKRCGGHLHIKTKEEIVKSPAVAS